MTLNKINTAARKAALMTAITAVAVILLSAAPQSQPAPSAPKSKPASSSSTPTGKAFDTPDLAAAALVNAAETYDVAALLEIAGPDGKDLVTSDDPVLDKNNAVAFAARAREKSSVKIDLKQPTHAVLLVGTDDFPYPIPMVNRKGKWYFDVKAGRQEILFRRIGENELDAIRICRGFVEAQHEYALTKHGDSLMAQYAQRIISTAGTQDGLAWQNPDGAWDGPVGEAIAKAIQEGYPVNQPPYHGYYFKVLKGQGPAAPAGAIDFVVNGAMIGGFALVAAPAQYRVTGVQTFIVNQDGIVYQKDLGPQTLDTLKTMELYNPDKTWIETDDATDE